MGFAISSGSDQGFAGIQGKAQRRQLCANAEGCRFACRSRAVAAAASGHSAIRARKTGACRIVFVEWRYGGRARRAAVVCGLVVCCFVLFFCCCVWCCFVLGFLVFVFFVFC